MDNIFNIPK